MEANKWLSGSNPARVETTQTKQHKRWSVFGPTMIKLFDKLLLPEGKNFSISV